jgi:hypothetical protein
MSLDTSNLNSGLDCTFHLSEPPGKSTFPILYDLVTLPENFNPESVL